VHDMIGEKNVDNQGKELHYLKTHIDFNVYLNENDKEVRDKHRKERKKSAFNKFISRILSHLRKLKLT